MESYSPDFLDVFLSGVAAAESADEVVLLFLDAAGVLFALLA
ncbi:MAG: hypothetical protein PVF56_09260 [Desulfobacterales bacterium]